MHTLRIREYFNPKSRVIVPQKLYTSFQHINQVQNGPYHAYCDCLSHDRHPDVVYISSALMEQIRLQGRSHCQLQVIEDTCIFAYQLGVFIASINHTNLSSARHFSLYEEMSRIGQTFGFDTIFFGYQHVDLTSNKIEGYHFLDNQWKRTTTNIPPVIYNRIPNRKMESHPKIKIVKQVLNTTSIIFNPDFFNKWQMYEYLMKEEKCRYLLPYTIFQPSLNTIEEMMEQNAVYLKPIHGSKGNGICLIEKIDDQIAITNYKSHTALKQYYRDIDSFQAEYFPKGFQHYVLQEAIPLMKHQGNAIDFRIHTNKDEQSNWQVTLIFGKQTSNKSFTTHITKGGSVLLLSQLFSAKEQKQIEQKLIETAINLSKIVDRSIHGTIGELGFDIGIDEEKKLWLFEINAKPGWMVFDHPQLSHLSRDVFSSLYQYAFFLQNNTE
ncbi:YheC/YheD family protein [Gracilibacillus sp. YIM 98692]|uniref:YheC/YheD family endospore coat-associated protein n=1 Tax=Gracilibacillus sp. YIM 98692 TaxID=2663532 RepID=UPI0013D52A02|nr:YheC/YheD family protein [Gracilibacillus sp. YIM 98692]